ncbi:POTRA domain-containing protein [Paludibaculum fermentans]|uniref:POTRA domain-containing protein n=1 Tax=Paludibaculum fermentans TaxID=1473598 RepID=A0A7S7SI36_PALFE|nr:POTRA domain-containing protein [Paludibaculum fermentans]QOY85298.1 hypothetical protein IRI77_20935 [Paludibaculum fermentans]
MRLAAIVLVAACLGWGQAPARRPVPARNPAAAQSAPNEIWPIREIRVTGNKFYTAEQVISTSGLRLGDLATKQNFERARDRVLAAGFFESFGWKYEGLPDVKGVAATLEVTEPTNFMEWSLDRLPLERAAVEERVRRSLPLFGKKIPPSDVLIDKVAAIMQAMLGEKGIKETVQGRVLLLGQDQVTILFGPNSAPPVVTEVAFTGARVLDSRYLVKALSQVAVGMPFVDTNFRLFLENQIRPMYEAVGHLKASFPKFTAEPSKTAKGVVVTVQVDEGPVYKLDKIEVRGAPISPEEVQNLAQFKTGETVSYSVIGAGMQRILDEVKQTGYMRATYKADRALNDEKKTVDIFINVDPGPEYKFGRLMIKGLDIETEPVLRKLWILKPGDPFRSKYPDAFLERVRERGIFDNLGDTKAETMVDDKNQLVDVVLTFKGAPPKVEKKPEPWD